uniref:peptide chain release factor N(5)-glutamine methyltransferase n=1 Tax=candidate division WOR-3 bacterium TaxID=2052148 RepID=A0A7C6EAV8_UNCW3
MKNLLGLIKKSAKELPKNEIEYILTALLNKKRYELYLTEIEIPDAIEQEFNRILQQRKKGVPIQYLLKTANFLDFELYVDERVFIPRPETEELVIKTISRLSSPNLILEIGTGSGAIAIALANAFPLTKIIATDIDQDALSVAKINIEKYKLSDRISLIKTNCLNLPEALLEAIDCLISNPPYIDSKTIPWLDKQVKDYEPRLSLDGGKDGFALIQVILHQGKKFLKPSGLIALEIDPSQKDLILAQVPWASFESDLSGKTRFCFIKYNQL